MPKKTAQPPPMWLERYPTHSQDAFHDLEQRAAINEFDSKLPRLDAEKKAHGDYMQEQHAKAAAHHLTGMKAAQGAGNMEEAKKHYTMYSHHAKALGHDPYGPVPESIRLQAEAPDRKSVYRFAAHPADMFVTESLNKHSEELGTETLSKNLRRLWTTAKLALQLHILNGE